MYVRINKLCYEVEPAAYRLWRENELFRSELLKVQAQHDLPVSGPVCFDPHYGDVLHSANDPVLTENTMRWFHERCWEHELDHLAAGFGFVHPMDVYLLWRIAFTGELNPPQPQLIEGTRKKDWRPVIEWLGEKNNRDISHRELARMLGLEYGYVRKKLGETATAQRG